MSSRGQLKTIRRVTKSWSWVMTCPFGSGWTPVLPRQVLTGPLSLPRRPPPGTPQGTQPAGWGPAPGTCIGTRKPQLCVGDSLSRPPGGGARGSFPVAPQPTWGQTPQSRPETTGPPPPGSLTGAGDGKKHPSSLCSHMALPCVSVLISLSFLLKVTGSRVHRQPRTISYQDPPPVNP